MVAYSFTANATDAATNPSHASAAVAVTVDTIPPDAPVITDPVAGTQKYCYIHNIRYCRRGSTVQVYDGSTSLGTTTTDTNGDWTLTLGSALADGNLQLYC